MIHWLFIALAFCFLVAIPGAIVEWLIRKLWRGGQVREDRREARRALTAFDAWLSAKLGCTPGSWRVDARVVEEMRDQNGAVVLPPFRYSSLFSEWLRGFKSPLPRHELEHLFRFDAQRNAVLRPFD